MIIARRRRHKDCTGAEGGCEVVTGRSCKGSGEGGKERWRRDWLGNVAVVILAASLIYLGHLGSIDFSRWQQIRRVLANSPDTLSETI